MSTTDATGQFDSNERDERLGEVIAEYLRAVAAGEPPNREEFLARHPDLADELRDFFANRDHIENLAGPLRSVAPPGPALGTVRYFGDYELLEEIARGGMGVVYKARQKTLDRIVAVKMILSGRLATDEDVKRFQVEAQAAAGLQHPNIVAIHEVGQHEGLHYFSMDYVEGRSLSAVLRENLLPAKRAATYVRQMAEAIHYAHQQGTLHRDLKPSNVLIDGRDQVRITDFGLAMRVEGDSNLTQTGQIVGTPSYMPPEQAQGKRSLIGPGSDVYSLGAILYECLTGRPPFRSDSVMKTIEQVIHVEAASPRLLNPGIARDLETICLKCLEKEPHRRYGTAQLLGDDLGRFLAGEPITARRISRPARLWRWCRRKPVVAGLGAMSALASTAAVATLMVSHLLVTSALRDRTNALTDLTHAMGKLATEEQNAREALAGKTQALIALGESNQSLKYTIDREQEANYYNNVLLAWREWQAGHIQLAEEHLDECRADLRGWEWHYIARLCRPTTSLATLERVQGIGDVHDGMEPPGIRLSGDGSRVAYAGANRTVLVLDASTGKEVFRVADVDHGVSAVAISHDGGRLAALGNGFVTVWDTSTIPVRIKRIDRSEEYNRLEFSPDATRLIASVQSSRAVSREDSLRRWLVLSATILDVESGKSLVSQGWGTPVPGNCAYALDGSRIATFRESNCSISQVSEDKTLEVISHDETIAGGVFSSDGTRIATFDVGSNILVSDAASGERISAWHLRPERIERIRFSPDGSKIATLSFLSTVSVWDASNGQLLASLRESEVERSRVGTPSTGAFGPFSFHQFFAFSPDGARLASASGNHKVTVWNLLSGKETTLRARDPLRFAAFNAGAEYQLLYATQSTHPQDARQSPDSSLNLSHWNTLGQSESRLLYRPGPYYHTVAVNHAGTRVASISKPGTGGLRNTVKVWDMQSGNEELSLPWEAGGQLFDVAFSPDDLLLAVAGDKGVAVIDLTRREIRSEVPQKVGQCLRVVFCRGGHRILVARKSGASIDDLRTGEALATFGMPRWCASAVLNPDETRVATGGFEGGIFIWNAKTGEKELDLTLNDKKHVYCVAFSPDSCRLVAADEIGRVLVWDALSGKRLLELPAHDGRTYTVAFSPDGKRLISMGDDGVLRVWDSKSGREILTLTGHADRVYSATFTRDGSQLVSTSADGTIRIWDGRPIVENN